MVNQFSAHQLRAPNSGYKVNHKIKFKQISFRQFISSIERQIQREKEATEEKGYTKHFPLPFDLSQSQMQKNGNNNKKGNQREINFHVEN